MTFFPQPAYALAGAGAVVGMRDAQDGYSTAVRNPAVDYRSRNPIPATLFAIHDDETIDIPPRTEESAEVGSGGGANAPAKIVTAYDVYTTLLSIPIRHHVILTDPALVNLVGTRDWMKEVTRGERDAMAVVAARLETTEAELARLEQAIKQNRPTLRRFLGAAKGIFSRKGAVQGDGESGGADERKDSVLNLTGVYRSLKARKRELEKKVEGERIAKEWLGRTAWSNCGCVFLTDAGCKVMAALDKGKGDSRMEKMSVDAYLNLIGTK